MSTIVSDPVVGHVLDGRYRIVSRLARGGMGTVYVALDLRLDRTVAVKVMHAGLASDHDLVRRFIGEAKSAAGLSHPNVVGVYDQGQDSGHVFLAMEYVPGRTLRDLLRERGRLDPNEALAIMEPVLAALGAAHRADLIHRDVKPENVLLADDGRVKVADFGLARAIASSNHTKTSGLLIGTVAYLSPEQVQHGSADPRSDVYAAGVMLFELLTGRQPFGGETPLAVAYKHVNEAVPAPSSLVPQLPAELDDLVARATEREPAHRPADANELLGVTLQTHRALPSLASPAGQASDTDQPTEMMQRHSHDTLMVPHPPVPEQAYGTPLRPPALPAALTRWPPGRTAMSGAIAVVALLAAVAVGFALLVTEVPKGLAGVTVQAADSKAERLGFRVVVGSARFSDDVPRDHVIATSPGSGAKIRKGGTIMLIPSKGPRMVEVPDVRGMSLEGATARLRVAGLAPGEVIHDYSMTVPKGEVIRTRPGIGERARHDSEVDVVVSRGVKIPDVRGLLSEKAEKELRKRGFDVEISEGFSADYPKGQVIAQDPVGGGARKGSTISLTVSKGPPLVAVPNVVGMTVDEAKKTLEDAGFQVRVHRILGDAVRMQRPAGEAPKGSVITLFAF